MQVRHWIWGRLPRGTEELSARLRDCVTVDFQLTVFFRRGVSRSDVERVRSVLKAIADADSVVVDQRREAAIAECLQGRDSQLSYGSLPSSLLVHIPDHNRIESVASVIAQLTPVDEVRTDGLERAQ
jgi:cell division protein FtsX